MTSTFWRLTCKCGEQMEHLVGNSGLQAYWCLCGRAAIKADDKVQKWLEPERTP